jgi:hypothetical protein
MLQKLDLEQPLSQAAVVAEDLAVFLTVNWHEVEPSQTAQGAANAMEIKHNMFFALLKEKNEDPLTDQETQTNKTVHLHCSPKSWCCACQNHNISNKL